MRRERDTSPVMTRRAALEAGVALILAGAAYTLGESKINKYLLSPAGATETKTKETVFAAKPSWEQNFAKMPNGKPNSKYWNYDTGNLIPSYTGEVETLTDRSENVRIQNGSLILEARKEKLNGRDYTSGRVNTQSKFSFQYGKLETVVKAPKGIGTWPAAWLLPNNPKATWPRDGEVDFFEGIGLLPNIVYPDAHTYDTENSKNQPTNPFNIYVPEETEQFHTFGVEMTPGKIAFTFDGNVYHDVQQTSDNIDSWPFNQPYFLIFDLAMGGPWAGTDKKKYPPYGIQGDGPWQMAIQSASYYELESESQPKTHELPYAA